MEATCYDQKAYITGDFAELYEYARPIWTGIKSRIRSIVEPDRIPKPRSVQSAMRTRKKIRQLVNSNPTLDKFLTLTFSDNVTDVCSANYEFKKFRQKLERYLGRKFKYLGVVEFQKRGAVHYHLMLDIPFLPWQKMSEIWGNGRIKIERITKKNRAGLYMAKTTSYLVKGLSDVRMFGKRVYFYSRTMLDKAVEICDNSIKAFRDLCSRLVDREPEFSRMFFIEGHGLIKYKLFSLNP